MHNSELKELKPKIINILRTNNTIFDNVSIFKTNKTIRLDFTIDNEITIVLCVNKNPKIKIIKYIYSNPIGFGFQEYSSSLPKDLAQYLKLKYA